MVFRSLISAAGLCAAFAAGAAAAAPPLEAYGRLPVVEDLELSPKGDRVAFITVDGEQRQLVVHRLDGKERIRLNAGNAKVRDLSWAGDDHLLITSSTTGQVMRFEGTNEWFQTGAYNLRTRKYVTLLDNTPNTLNSVMGDPMVARHRGEPTVFVRGITMKGDGSYDLYRVDLDSGRGAIHTEGGRGVGDWVLAPDGVAVARSHHDDRRGLVTLAAKAGAGWRPLLQPEKETEATSLAGLGRRDGTLFVYKRDGDKHRLHEIAVTGGAMSAPLDDPSKMLEGVIFDPETRRPLAITYLGRTREYVFFDPEHDKAWRSARAPFRTSNVSLESWTPDFKKLVLKVEGPEDAGSYYLVDLASKKADLIADAFPKVQPEDIAPVRWITYKAADGLGIPAYLTLPPGRASAKNLPLIVLPHGGPQARDEPEFDWWSQALASRGYAVLQPQFRGSDGFGRKFVEAGYGQWGRKMQSDLSDGVRHLAKEGVVDAKRVCIMGASYGGYAAMAGVTLDPGVYRCSVAVAGVGDLAGMMAWEAKNAGRSNTGSVRYWSKFMGSSFRKRSELDAVSPTQQAAKADAPILVIHGKDDTVVPYAQSADFVRAMQKAGKPVEFITLNGEDHWLSRGATRLQMLQSAVAFVEKHNPPT